VGGPNNGFQSASKFTYRLGFNAQLDPSNLVYGSVSTGYKPGGFNDFDPATGQVGTYEPESLRAYELGYKGRLFDNLRFDSSIFYYDYSLNQISSLVLFPLTSGGVVGVIYTRAASTEVKGWENELIYTVAPRTSITARAALLDSQYRSLRVGLFRQIDWRGERLDSSPSFVGSIGVNHAFELSNGAELRLRAFSKYSSSYLLSDLAQAQRFKQKGYTRSDISVTYAAPGDKYYVQAFVENIEDALQATQAPSFNAASLAGNLNASTVGVTTPRFFGVRFGFNFQ
jgi:iron complex outermembrane receptor protein